MVSRQCGWLGLSGSRARSMKRVWYLLRGLLKSIYCGMSSGIKPPSTAQHSIFSFTVLYSFFHFPSSISLNTIITISQPLLSLQSTITHSLNMSFKAAAVILLSLASTSLAAPFSNGTSTRSSPTASGTGVSATATGKPTTFTGDGTPGAGWPTEDKWATYSAMQEHPPHPTSAISSTNRNPVSPPTKRSSLHPVRNSTSQTTPPTRSRTSTPPSTQSPTPRASTRASSSPSSCKSPKAASASTTPSPRPPPRSATQA